MLSCVQSPPFHDHVSLIGAGGLMVRPWRCVQVEPFHVQVSSRSVCPASPPKRTRLCRVSSYAAAAAQRPIGSAVVFAVVIGEADGRMVAVGAAEARGVGPD